MKYYLLFIFISFNSFIIAQDFPSGIDSIDVKIKEIKIDSLKVKYITNLILRTQYNRIELLPYAEAALEISQRLKLPYLIAKSNSAIALIYYFNLNFDKSILYSKKAELIYKENKDYWSLIENYIRTGRAYYYWGYSDLAIHQYKKSVKAAEKVKSLKDIAEIKREIGYNYIELNKPETAYKYLQSSLEIAIKNNFESDIAYDYLEIGKYYHFKKEYKKAISYQKKSLNISINIGHKHSRGYSSLFLSQSYRMIGEIDSAEKYCKFVLNVAREKLKNKAYKLAAKIYLDKNNFKKALAYADSTYNYSSQMHNFKILNEVYEIYVDIYTNIGLLNKANDYKNKQLRNYDSIVIYTNKQKIKNIEILENIDKYEKDNKLLQNEKEQQEFKLKNSKQINIAFSAIIFLFVIIIIGAFYTLKKIKKKSSIILSQNMEIETQNEEIKTQNESLNEKNNALAIALKQLKEAQMHVVQSEKMASLGVLTAGIAHEINNPLNFIYAGVNSIQKDFKDIDIIIKEYNQLKTTEKDINEKLINIDKLKKEYYFDDAYEGLSQTLMDIRIGAERTIEIVKGLRNFSRVDKGEWILADVHEGIDASLLLLKNKYKNRIEVIKNYDKNLPKIECLPGKLNQAIINIINNAIDAIPEKGKIFINTEIKNINIFVKIKDTGMGISTEVKKHIYEPFFTTKEVGKGVGIGLSITYGIIKDHNGKININSEINEGTEFIIQLPVKQDNSFN